MPFESFPHVGMDAVEEDEEQATVGIESTEGGILLDAVDGLADAYPHLFKEEGRILLLGGVAYLYAVDINQGKVIVCTSLMEKDVSEVVVFGHDALFVQVGGVFDEVLANQSLLFVGEIHLWNVAHQGVGQ